MTPLVDAHDDRLLLDGSPRLAGPHPLRFQISVSWSRLLEGHVDLNTYLIMPLYCSLSRSFSSVVKGPGSKECGVEMGWIGS